MELARPLRGIIPPLVTPLCGQDRHLDAAGLEALIDVQLAGGVHGVFILGTTGEGPSLNYAIRRELVQRTVAQVAGRIPVLVGVTDTIYDESRRMADFAAAAGASAIVTAPPYYFHSSQSDLLRIVEQLTKDCSLPLFLYNMPGMTKMVFEPETVVEAAKLPGVHGLKDSSGDLDYLIRVLDVMRHRPNFSILLGPEHLLRAGMRLGVHGGVHGGANLTPRLFVDLYEACLDDDEPRIEQLHEEVLSLGKAVFDAEDAEYRYIRGIKCGLSVLGICSDLPAWPYLPAGPKLRRSIEEHLRKSAADSGITRSES